MEGSNNKNEFRIDLGNPAVAEFFSTKRAGDKCEFTIRGTVKTVDPQNAAVVAIDKLIYEEGEEKEVEPEPEAPMKMELYPSKK